MQKTNDDIMKLPRFILGDNSEMPEAIFIIHTEFPRFIINLENDDLQFWEDVAKIESEQLADETELLVKEAYDFYDAEISQYEEE